MLGLQQRKQKLADAILGDGGSTALSLDDVDDLFASPRHPYTIGLLNSLPRFDEAKSELLQAIPGQPPDLAHLPSGCAFRERCVYSKAECASIDPPLEPTSNNRSAACLVDVQTSKPRSVSDDLPSNFEVPQ